MSTYTEARIELAKKCQPIADEFSKKLGVPVFISNPEYPSFRSAFILEEGNVIPIYDDKGNKIVPKDNYYSYKYRFSIVGEPEAEYENPENFRIKWEVSWYGAELESRERHYNCSDGISYNVSAEDILGYIEDIKNPDFNQV